MVDPVLGALLAGAGAVAVLVPGYLIRFRHRSDLVVGYHPETSPVPEAEMTRYVGDTVLRIGVGLAALAIAVALGHGSTVIGAGIALWMAISVILSAHRLRKTLQKYGGSPPSGAT